MYNDVYGYKIACQVTVKTALLCLIVLCTVATYKISILSKTIFCLGIWI